MLAIVSSRTSYGSPQTFSVLSQRSGWLNVGSPELRNGQRAWIPVARTRLTTTGWAVRVLRSRRRLIVLYDGREMRSFTVGVGSPASPTPLGRFSITDKLPGAPFSGAYGCCILALSGDQPHPPPGLTVRNQLAIHGTDEPWTIGRADSAGCVHATAVDMRYLMARIPLGAPVIISR